MNKSIACIFPETLPDERLLFPLVQVFGQVVHLQAIENEPPEQGAETAFSEQCRRQGRLQRFTPVPLGSQRERFIALIQDMRRRGEAYTSQLGMLTLAGINRHDHRESHHSILSNLLRHGDIKEQQETELLIWQSRLIVKLGEFYDIEQAELSNALDAITSRQDTLLAELCEEEEGNPFVLPGTNWGTGQDTDGVLRHRLKAWTRLCFHGGNSAPGLLVTHHQTAMDLLQEVYEKLFRNSPQQLISLEIPVIACGQHDADLEEPLMRQCPSLDKAMARLAATGCGLQLEEDMEELFRTGLSEWSRCISRFYSSGRDERRFLDLILFPEISAQRLFAESFTGSMLSGNQLGEEKNKVCVVGLLRMG